MNKELAECIGLWLAEGDNKTIREVTFTNNCFDLILFFQRNIEKLYKGNNKPRLYIYSPTRRQLFYHLKGFKKINFYIDTRANRPYYIYRLADTQFTKKWKKIVEETKNKKEFYSDILRGIFAGEGNVKHSLKYISRNIRIASGKRNKLIEKILNFYNIIFKFDENKRQYWITGRFIDILNEINIASLHPEKEAKFRIMVNTLKEKHYSPGELKLLVLNKLDKFYQTKDLANIFKRSNCRILEVLTELKKENKIDKININANWFWIKKSLKDEYLYKEKIKILNQFKKGNNLTKAGRFVGLSRKAIHPKILKYQKEGLIDCDYKNKIWKMTEKGKLVCGIDEAGSLV